MDFKTHWREKNLPEVAMPGMMPMFPMYGIGESVNYGGFRYAVVDFDWNDKEKVWCYDLIKLDGSDEKVSDIYEPGLCKSQAFAKPGDSTHTAKWDRCVQHVSDHGGSSNAYAVCTAMMGDESFKSIEKSEEDFLIKVDEYIDRLGITAGLKAQKAVGTAFAGGVPNSLLARQDLEPRVKASEYALTNEDPFATTKSRDTADEYALSSPHGRRTGQDDGAKYAMKSDSEHDLTIEIHNGSEKAQADGVGDSVYVCFTDAQGEVQERTFKTESEAEAFMEQIKALDCYTGIKMELRKGQVEEAKKDLIEMAETDASKTTLAARIKAAQIKAQKGTIAARAREGDAVGKTFAEAWRGL